MSRRTATMLAIVAALAAAEAGRTAPVACMVLSARLDGTSRPGRRVMGCAGGTNMPGGRVDDGVALFCGRRAFVAAAILPIQIAAAAAPADMVAASTNAAAAAADAAEAPLMIVPASSRRALSVGNGVQFGDLRVGRGEAVKKGDEVVMHIRALLPDKNRPEDTLLFDTRAKNGPPILHQLGSVDDSSVLGQRGKGVGGSAGRKPLVTIGLEDAIAAAGGNAMREGGVRKVLVPAALAYGTAAMSRFDAQQSGFVNPVGLTGFDIRYEVELLRCSEVPLPPREGEEEPRTARVCCSDVDYPCKR